LSCRYVTLHLDIKKELSRDSEMGNLHTKAKRSIPFPMFQCCLTFLFLPEATTLNAAIIYWRRRRFGDLEP